MNLFSLYYPFHSNKPKHPSSFFTLSLERSINCGRATWLLCPVSCSEALTRGAPPYFFCLIVAYIRPQCKYFCLKIRIYKPGGRLLAMRVFFGGDCHGPTGLAMTGFRTVREAGPYRVRDPSGFPVPYGYAQDDKF